jgi:hypothetical protein
MFSNKEIIKNLVIAASFIAIGGFMPNSTLTDPTTFSANVAGISMGIGIGWMLKTLIEQKSAKKEA